MPLELPRLTGDDNRLRAVVSSFARGIVDTITPDQIPDDAVADALNVEFDRRKNLRTRQGCSRLNWNGNVLGDVVEDFGGWDTNDLIVGTAAFDSPTGDDADALTDDNVGDDYATSPVISEADDSEMWGASIYFRLPVDPFDPPASFLVGDGGAIPGLVVQFSSGTPISSGAALVPSAAAASKWAAKPILAGGMPYNTIQAPVDYAIGEAVVDDDDADFQWIQVIVHARNNASGNGDVNLLVTPALSNYSIIDDEHVVYSSGPNGAVTPTDASENDAAGLGVWGAWLERGRIPARRPNTSGDAATIAANYFTSRVTSVFYYRASEDDDSIIATCGADVYRFVPSNAWFEKITDSFEFPEDTLWQWTVFDGVLYGVNRGTGTRASSILAVSGGTNFADGKTVTIGATVYAWESGTLDAPFKVKIGADHTESLENLVAAINLDPSLEDIAYATATTRNPDGFAAMIDDDSLRFTADAFGTAANALATSEDDTNAAWTGATLDGGAGEQNPIALDDPEGDLYAPRGLPPPGRYINTWNGRLWIVPEDDLSIVSGSKLGDAEEWTDADAAAGTVQVSPAGHREKFDITGIHPHQGALLTFKRDRLYAISPGGQSPFDASELRSDLVTLGIGSISGYAIRTLLEDVIFMSSFGLAALSLIEKFGVFRENLVSRDVQAFADPEIGTERAILEVYPRKSQALVAFAPRLGIGNTNSYLLDYRGVAQAEENAPAIAFTRLSGPPQAASACLADVNGEERMLLGGDVDTTGIAYVWLYDEEGSFEDEGVRYPVRIETKAYAWGDVFRLKAFHRWEALIELLEDDVDLTFTWRPDLQEAVFQQFPRVLEGQALGTGARWGSAVWGSSRWAVSDIVNNVFTGGRFAGSNDFGKYARALAAVVIPSGDPSGFVLKGLALRGSWGKESSSKGTSPDVGGVSLGTSRAMIEETGDEMIHED